MQLVVSGRSCRRFSNAHERVRNGSFTIYSRYLKKLIVTAEVAKSLPLGIGDEQRLAQRLLKLVGDAIKFTDSGKVRAIAKTVSGHFNVSPSKRAYLSRSIKSIAPTAGRASALPSPSRSLKSMVAASSWNRSSASARRFRYLPIRAEFRRNAQ